MKRWTPANESQLGSSHGISLSVPFKLAISHDSLVKLSDIQALDLFIQMFFWEVPCSAKKRIQETKEPMKMEGLIGQQIRRHKGLRALHSMPQQEHQATDTKINEWIQKKRNWEIICEGAGSLTVPGNGNNSRIELFTIKKSIENRTFSTLLISFKDFLII